MWAGRPTRGARGGSLGPCRPARAGPYVRLMKIQIHQGTDLYEGNYRLGGIRDRVSGVDLQPPVMQRHRRGTQLGRRVHRRQSFLHTASGWLALICLVAAVLLLALKHKDSILGRQAPAQQAHQGPSARQNQVPTPVPGRASGFCAKCGTRIIAGDRFCQGCGVPMGSL